MSKLIDLPSAGESRIGRVRPFEVLALLLVRLPGEVVPSAPAAAQGAVLGTVAHLDPLAIFRRNVRNPCRPTPRTHAHRFGMRRKKISMKKQFLQTCSTFVFQLTASRPTLL